VGNVEEVADEPADCGEGSKVEVDL